ncbi:UNVERIFIED_CONTAM: proline-rich protein [Sesamum radiatum]|uniref:Proline-rich protein n=1 Tax=Sesamum radiatum TaxID=300843 RepID=A0AAW2T5Y6_SESRA
MAKYNVAQVLILLLNLGTLLISLACPYCPYPTPPSKPPKLPPKLPPKHPPKVKPPPHSRPPKSPVVKPPPYVPKPPPSTPKPPVVHPPVIPKPPIVHPPIVYPPVIPKPPIVHPPIVNSVSTTTTITSPPKAQETCPIDTLKLGACVDVLGGLVHIGIGSSAKDTCCPVLQGLVDLDAAVCLCTTIKAKLLNINIILPIALEVLVDCGKTPPSDFQCPA